MQAEGAGGATNVAEDSNDGMGFVVGEESDGAHDDEMEAMDAEMEASGEVIPSVLKSRSRRMERR